VEPLTSHSHPNDPIWGIKNEGFGGVSYPFSNPLKSFPLPLKKKKKNALKQDLLNLSFLPSFYCPSKGLIANFRNEY
jgi:hypothetical protein